MKFIKTFENHSNNYYRATPLYLGEETLFKPTNFYEGIKDDNSSAYKYGSFWTSTTPETCASKYIGGAVLGASSMFREHSKFNEGEKLFIYSINENPDKDISHWSLQDFEYLQEVRYRKDVTGHYTGYVILTKEMIELFNKFYEYLSHGEDEYNEFPEEGTKEYEDFNKIINMIQHGTFQKYLNNIKLRK